MKKLAEFNKTQQKTDLPQIQPGMRVKVWQKIKEGDKERLQSFEGLVIAKKHGQEPGASFTVRGNVFGYSVEKIYPLYSPTISKIEVLGQSKTRRAKLYFVRSLSPKKLKRKLKTIASVLTPSENKQEQSAQ